MVDTLATSISAKCPPSMPARGQTSLFVVTSRVDGVNISIEPGEVIELKSDDCTGPGQGEGGLVAAGPVRVKARTLGSHPGYSSATG